MKRLLPVVFALISGVQAATVAIIDSGMDHKHELISPNLWNSDPTFASPFKGVKHGWNFVNKSGELMDHSLVDSFSPDVKKFYQIQSKFYLFQVTEEERAWAKEMQKDQQFLRELDRFGNFVHGTHVAGIAVKDSSNKAMGITYLPTRAKSLMTKFLDETPYTDDDNAKSLDDMLNSLVSYQMDGLRFVALFLALYNVNVANGSFGTGPAQAALVIDSAYQMIYGRAPTDEEKKKGVALLLAKLIGRGKNFVSAAPNVLFVFAAGNESQNNDETGISPANIKADNTITVAATYQDRFFAPFSNYGTKMVEVAAPGMMIRSSIPGNDYLSVSGTSQAAPFVANVAGKVKDANPKLTPAQIKKILMETVDKKDFLSTRVTSGGMVNASRARMAGLLSKLKPLDEAIAESFRKFPNSEAYKFKSSAQVFNARPIPLPSMLEL